MPTATVSENPQTFNEINIQQSFNNLIDSLKTGIEDIVTSISENNETNNQILDIGPVKIDESSINALTEQFGASMEAQISRLIDVVRGSHNNGRRSICCRNNGYYPTQTFSYSWWQP